MHVMYVLLYHIQRKKLSKWVQTYLHTLQNTCMYSKFNSIQSLNDYTTTRALVSVRSQTRSNKCD